MRYFLFFTATNLRYPFLLRVFYFQLLKSWRYFLADFSDLFLNFLKSLVKLVFIFVDWINNLSVEKRSLFLQSWILIELISITAKRGFRKSNVNHSCIRKKTYFSLRVVIVSNFFLYNMFSIQNWWVQLAFWIYTWTLTMRQNSEAIFYLVNINLDDSGHNIFCPLTVDLF